MSSTILLSYTLVFVVRMHFKKEVVFGVLLICGFCFWYRQSICLATNKPLHKTILSFLNADHKEGTKNIGRNYSVIAGSLPDFANQTVHIDEHGVPQGDNRAWGYAFDLPMTALAWKRMGFDTLAIITYDNSRIDDKARALWRYIDKALRHVGATPIYFDVPSLTQSRLGQVLRDAIGDIAETLGLNDNDFILTGDADYWPLMKSRYELQEDKDILITNAYCCCGTF